MNSIRFKGMFSLFLATVLSLSVALLPNVASAGAPVSSTTSTVTDTENPLLLGYWDLRDRESYFQVTNTTGEEQRIHIQIYNAAEDCLEFNYYDTLTPRDTHVYNVAELDRNNGVELSAPDFSDSHGIVAVTHVDGSDALDPEPVLTGNFRINDVDGFRYQTNLAGVELLTEPTPSPSPVSNHKDINFNSVEGSSFADLVVINGFVEENPGGFIPEPEVYEVTLYDEDENAISCSDVLLGCFSDIDIFDIFDGFSDTHINVGVNQAVTNSRGGPSLCFGNDTDGYLELTPQESFLPIQVMFMGLNNAGGTGSMDSVIETTIEIILD